MIAVVASLTFVLTGSAAPTPGPGEPRPRFAVEYDDLNFRRDKHVDILMKRLDAAAAIACGTRDESLDAACRAAAVGRAVQIINAPRLTAAHQAGATLASTAG